MTDQPNWTGGLVKTRRSCYRQALSSLGINQFELGESVGGLHNAIRNDDLVPSPSGVPFPVSVVVLVARPITACVACLCCLPVLPAWCLFVFLPFKVTLH